MYFYSASFIRITCPNFTFGLFLQPILGEKTIEK